MANMRVRQAAEYVGVSKSLLDKLRCYGGGPAYAKLGTSVIYNTDDLDDWIAARRIEPANDNQRAARPAA
jgi:excisionase family DNA binding protein